MIYSLEERLAIADTINTNIRMAISQVDYDTSKTESEKIDLKHLMLDKFNIKREA